METIHNPTPQDIKELGRISTFLYRGYQFIMDDHVLQKITDKHIANQFKKINKMKLQQLSLSDLYNLKESIKEQTHIRFSEIFLLSSIPIDEYNNPEFDIILNGINLASLSKSKNPEITLLKYCLDEIKQREDSILQSLGFSLKGYKKAISSSDINVKSILMDRVITLTKNDLFQKAIEGTDYMQSLKSMSVDELKEEINRLDMLVTNSQKNDQSPSFGIR